MGESFEEEQEEEATPEIETLPLFPMHAEDITGFCNIKPESDAYYSGWYRPADAKTSSRTSLELSLNSYAGRSPDSPWIFVHAQQILAIYFGAHYFI